MARRGMGVIIATMSGKCHLPQATYFMTPFVWMSRKDRTDWWDWWWQKSEHCGILGKLVLTGKGHTGCFQGAGNELCLDRGGNYMDEDMWVRWAVHLNSAPTFMHFIPQNFFRENSTAITQKENVLGWFPIAQAAWPIQTHPLIFSGSNSCSSFFLIN